MKDTAQAPVPVGAPHWYATLGAWDFYFIAKLFLYFVGLISFHFAANLVFALCVMARIGNAHLRLARRALLVPVGIALFYYDTWLPPLGRLVAQAPNLDGFQLTYLVELAGRFINPWVCAGLLLLYGLYVLARKRFRVSSFVLLGMLVTLLPIFDRNTPGGMAEPVSRAALRGAGPAVAAPRFTAPPSESELDGALASFYAAESRRKVPFTAPAPADPAFDIIVLQVCSLSWDDLDLVADGSKAFFDQSDIVFTNFNSAASYSGPAVTRLLRASGGQQMHRDLYQPPVADSLLFEQLRGIGYEPQIALNHDGRYGNLLGHIREWGGFKEAPFPTQDATPYLLSFDGSSVLDDASVLSRWWERRLTNPSPRVALFYNTISLHDGNRKVGSTLSNSLETYQPRLRKLLADLGQFMSKVQASGRKAVVVVVPEHGASIRGDKMQIAGMREIPSPRITLVPVAIHFVGLAQPTDTKPVRVTEPSSYLALSGLLAETIRRNPFGNGHPGMDDYVRELPLSGFVAENADLVVMRFGRQYFMRSKETTWVEYDPSR